MRLFTRLIFLSTLGWGVGCSSQAPIPVSHATGDEGGATGEEGGSPGDQGGSSSGLGPPTGDSGGAACSFNGSTYTSGAQFPSGDGCNVCICCRTSDT